jgi:hypothetical protein
MDACLRRAGPRAAAFLQEAERENAEFYQLLKNLTGKRSGGSALSSFNPASSTPTSPPTASTVPGDACPLDCSSDDGDLFSRDGSSSGDDTSGNFHLSLLDTSSGDADALVAFARACCVTSAAWRCQAAACAHVLLQRMRARALEIAEASSSNSGCWAAAVAAAAYTSHLARVSLMLLPHLPRADHEKERQNGAACARRSAGAADDDQVHLARWSRAARLDENANRHPHHLQQQQQQQQESSLRATWMNVWRNCRSSAPSIQNKTMRSVLYPGCRHLWLLSCRYLFIHFTFALQC